MTIQSTETELIRERRIAWLKALVSGRFRQGHSDLCHKAYPGSGYEYCCLGVAKKAVLGKAPEEIIGDLNRFYLQPSELALLGISDDDQKRYARKNDARVPFIQIAADLAFDWGIRDEEYLT